MKDQRPEISRLYQTALQEYLKQGPGSGLELARELGDRALAIGLQTLDLARIHETALVALVLPGYSANACDNSMVRAGLFFAEAITPIEQTQRGASEVNGRLNQVITALNQRTEELDESVGMMKREIVQRKVLEDSLRNSQETSSRLLEKSRLMQDELRQLFRQLLSAQEEELRKIGRDLQDVIAQTLTGINDRLADLKSESGSDIKELQEKIASTQKLVKKSVDIVHRFARELRPTVLDDLGLIPALQSFMKTFMEDTGVRVTLKAFAGIEPLDSARRTMLYRIIQEALTNVAHHAKASSVEVTLHELEGVIRLEITDNGQGFEVNENTPAKASNRLGLLGMSERAAMFGGTFHVESAAGKPTTIRVEIPAS